MWEIIISWRFAEILKHAVKNQYDIRKSRLMPQKSANAFDSEIGLDTDKIKKSMDNYAKSLNVPLLLSDLSGDVRYAKESLKPVNSPAAAGTQGFTGAIRRSDSAASTFISVRSAWFTGPLRSHWTGS
jgi:hypothetical protein